jgi:MFS family permease
MVGFDLGIALAGPVLGWLALYLGYKTVFGLSAGLSFLALAVFVTLSGRNLSNSWKFALGRDKDVYAVEPGQ